MLIRFRRGGKTLGCKMGNKDFGCGFWEIADGIIGLLSFTDVIGLVGLIRKLDGLLLNAMSCFLDRFPYFLELCANSISSTQKKDLVCLKIPQKNTQIELNKWDLSTNQHYTNTFVDERSYCNCEKYYKILSNYRDFLKKIGIF